MEVNTPEALVEEHRKLCDRLQRAGEGAGPLAEAARSAFELIKPHMAKEEAFALPALGLLPRVASGTVTVDMAQVVVLTNQLKADLGTMLREHDAIRETLEALGAAARRERHSDVAELADRFVQHLKVEEQIGYLAAILVGEYVRLRLVGIVDLPFG